MTCKVDSRHIRIGRMQILIISILRFRVSHEVNTRIEMGNVHRLRLIVSRCTIDAVALVRG